MKSKINKIMYATLFCVVGFICNANAQSSQAVTFKAPAGFHVGEFKDFKGVLMLDLKNPAFL